MRNKTEHVVRREVAEASCLLCDRGWVANHDGNITARVSPGRIVATPTAVSKRSVTSDCLIVVDEQRRVVSGRARAFSELGLHLVVYASRNDVAAVVHAHPPYATAWASSGRALTCFVPESVVSLGVDVPLVPLAAPGAAAENSLGAFTHRYDAVLLESHGVLAWGADVEQAFLRLELVEHLCRIAALAEPLGGVRALPADVIRALLEARRKAGLGPDARNA